MRLVEAVSGELVDQVEDVVARLLVVLVDLLAALDEQGALPIHLGLLLLAHRTAHHVCSAETEAGEDLRRLHDLFLIDEDPVGLAQDVLEKVVRVDDSLTALLALDEGVDHAAFERTGSVQRHSSDDVFETVGLEPREQLLEARGFQLEHPGRVPATDHRVDFGVVHRNGVDVEQRFARPVRGLGMVFGALDRPFDRRPRGERLQLAVVDQPHRVGNDGEGLQPQEVELDQPRLFGVDHRVLGDDLAVGAETRHVLPQRSVADDHPRGMHTGVADEALERGPHLHHLGRVAVGTPGGKLRDPAP